MNKNAVDALLEMAGDIPTAVAEPEFKPSLPATKGALTKLSAEQLDTLVEAHGFKVPGEWAEGTAKERHAILSVILGFTKPKKGSTVEVQVAPKDEIVAAPPVTQEMAEDGPIMAGPVPTIVTINIESPDVEQVIAATLKDKAKTQAAVLHVSAPGDNPIMQVAQDIESLTDQASIESEITNVLASEGMNDFRLGGLMLKLLEVGVFADNSTFKEYIEQRWGLKYRKARYLIELYNGLLKSGVSWETVAGIGWSKVITLLPVLTPENAEEWVQKAKQYNNDTLQGAVKAALAGDGSTNPSDASLEQSKLKTLTFGVGPDQEELIKEAVEHAMQVGQTEHKGVALELICTEYLGNTSGLTKQTKGKPPVASASPEGQIGIDYVTMKSHQQTLKTAVEATLQPGNIFKHFLEQANGDVPTAMSLLFGDAFDTAFPGVNVSIDIPG